MPLRLAQLFSILCLGLTIGCKGIQTDTYQDDVFTPDGEPAYITVQHCLISFTEQIPSSNRTMEEAEQLALELFEKAKDGEDFDKIVTKYTDDSPPGIYRMANHGFSGDKSSVIPSRMIYPRRDMAPAFGDVGFPLKVGEFGLATYDEENSPFGWHIVKRIK